MMHRRHHYLFRRKLQLNLAHFWAKMSPTAVEKEGTLETLITIHYMSLDCGEETKGTHKRWDSNPTLEVQEDSPNHFASIKPINPNYLVNTL